MHPFLGREMALEKKYSEHTAQLIDDEVMKIMREMQEKVRKILQENQQNLEKIAAKLLEKETLTNEEIDQIMEKENEDE